MTPPTTNSELPEISADSTSLEELAHARALSWVARSSRGLEVLRFRQGVSILEHPRLQKGPAMGRRLDQIGITDGPVREHWDRMLVTNEGDLRKKLRIPLAGLFRPAQMAKLQSHVRATINQALDEIHDLSSVDFMQALAWKIPPRVYCHLVSAPAELGPRVARFSDSVLSPILTANPARRQESIDAFAESWEFVKQHIEARRQNLGDDFTSIMIKQQMDGLLTEYELISEGVSILQASIDNTVHQLGLIFGTLLEDPERWARVVADPKAVPAAIEEVIRLRPRFGTIFRFAPEEVEFQGQVIPANSWIFVSVRSANRDQEVFPEPDSFRFDRSSLRALQFGAGPYNCLGQTLARLEISETLKVIGERFPRTEMLGQWTRHDTNAVTETGRLQIRLQ